MDKDQLSLEYAFKYFDLHAKQRMTVFQFFLGLSGVAIGVIAASLGGQKSFPLVGLFLSVFLICLCYTFWQLDVRTSFLIKHSEKAITLYEKNLFDPSARLVGNEKLDYQRHKRENGFFAGLTYSKALRSIFLLVGALALAGAIMSLDELGFLDHVSFATLSRCLCGAPS